MQKEKKHVLQWCYNNVVKQWCKTSICTLYCDLLPIRQKHHKYDELVGNQNVVQDEEWNKVLVSISSGQLEAPQVRGVVICDHFLPRAVTIYAAVIRQDDLRADQTRGHGKGTAG